MRQFINIVNEATRQYTDIEFVCINPETGGSDPTKVKSLYDELKTMPGLLLVRQDYMEEAGHIVLRAIILDPTVVSKKEVLSSAKRHGVEIDVIQPLPPAHAENIIDEMMFGKYENQIDALTTSNGYLAKGVCWSPENERWEGHLNNSVNEGEVVQFKPKRRFLRHLIEIVKMGGGRSHPWVVFVNGQYLNGFKSEEEANRVAASKEKEFDKLYDEAKITLQIMPHGHEFCLLDRGVSIGVFRSIEEAEHAAEQKEPGSVKRMISYWYKSA